jgi:hypothetical protein
LKQQQERLAVQEEEPRLLAVNDQQDLVKVVSTNNFEDRKAIKALAAVQLKNPKINKHCFCLCSIQVWHLAECYTKTT